MLKKVVVIVGLIIISRLSCEQFVESSQTMSLEDNAATNLTCPENVAVAKSLQQNIMILNDMQMMVDRLSVMVTCNMVGALVILLAYVPILYTTYKQLAASENRIQRLTLTPLEMLRQELPGRRSAQVRPV